MNIVISYVIYSSLTFRLGMGDTMSLDVALHRLFEQATDSTSNSLLKQEKDEECRPKRPHYFGYLTEHDKDTCFPEECLVCSRVVDCILLPLVSLNAHLVMKVEEENVPKRLAPFL